MLRSLWLKFFIYFCILITMLIFFLFKTFRALPHHTVITDNILLPIFNKVFISIYLITSTNYLKDNTIWGYLACKLSFTSFMQLFLIFNIIVHDLGYLLDFSKQNRKSISDFKTIHINNFCCIIELVNCLKSLP